MMTGFRRDAKLSARVWRSPAYYAVILSGALGQFAIAAPPAKVATPVNPVVVASAITPVVISAPIIPIPPINASVINTLAFDPFSLTATASVSAIQLNTIMGSTVVVPPPPPGRTPVKPPPGKTKAVIPPPPPP